jgi:hypothetical protein
MTRLGSLALLLILSLGCGTRVVLTIPHLPGTGPPPLARPDDECRYLSVLVDFSTQGTGMTSRDVQLSAHVAEVMKRELAQIGAHVTDDPRDAYWSLMVMAVHNRRNDGYLFSAMLTLRNLREGHDPGLATYAKPEQEALPTMYTGMSYGSHQEVDHLARQWIRKADEALLPSAREMCEFEAAEARRRTTVDEQVPHPDVPL